MDKLDINHIQRYFDEGTGEPLDLCFDYHEIEYEGITVKMEGVPLLKNANTEKIYYPNKTKSLILYFVEEAKRKGKAAISLKPKERTVRYPFAKKVDFKYSHIDYEYIPGLVRPWDEGFLTPVFFNIEVLNKYAQHPDYKIDLFSETYGTIYKGNEWNISFGINKNKKVIMWLGDIDDLPDEEKYYLRSENIESDHDIHSEFYDAQIEAQFSEPSTLTAVFHERKKLNDLIAEKYGFDLYLFEGEISGILEELDRPVFWGEKHISRFIESLNRIFVESINSKELKQYLKSLSSNLDAKNLKGLKLFQLWLGSCLALDAPEELMSPFFILYDFRILLTHLLSAEKKASIKKSICDRLMIEDRENNYEEIYEQLISMILNSFKVMVKSISDR